MNQKCACNPRETINNKAKRLANKPTEEIKYKTNFKIVKKQGKKKQDRQNKLKRYNKMVDLNHKNQ